MVNTMAGSPGGLRFDSMACLVIHAAQRSNRGGGLWCSVCQCGFVEETLIRCVVWGREAPWPESHCAFLLSQMTLQIELEPPM
jgi:hypothetical protein